MKDLSTLAPSTKLPKDNQVETAVSNTISNSYSNLNVVQLKQLRQQSPSQFHHAVLTLQRTIGNRAVVQLLSQLDSTESKHNIHQVAAAGTQGSGNRMPHLDTIQKSFGKHDISHVQTFTGTSAKAACESIGAAAYATGTKIAFRQSNPDLHTTAHEATHIVQQQAGVHLKGGVGEENDRYEHQADEVADRVVKGENVEALLSDASSSINQQQITPVTQSIQMARTKKPAAASSSKQNMESEGEEEPPQKEKKKKVTRKKKPAAASSSKLDMESEGEEEPPKKEKKKKVTSGKKQEGKGIKRKRGDVEETTNEQDAAEEEKSAPPKKRVRQPLPKKKEGYIFSLDEELHKAVKQREKDLEAFSNRHLTGERDDSEEGEQHSDSERLEKQGVKFLGKLKRLFNKRIRYKEDYPTGEKKGESIPFEFKNAKFKVRFDKEKEKFYPRVSRVDADTETTHDEDTETIVKENKKNKNKKPKDKTNKDKTTKQLAELIDSYEHNQEHFLAGVTGKDLSEHSGESENEPSNRKKAYHAGLEAHTTSLISDFLDYPGNSVISQELLRDALPENYKELFVGDRYEGSYGALPSQNQNATTEASTDRISVYKHIGEFISEGTNFPITTAQTNIPTLRKFRSLTKFLKEKIKIKYKEAGDTAPSDKPHQEFTEEFLSKQITARHQSYKKKYKSREVFSDPEEDRVEEVKYDALNDKDLDNYINNLQEKILKLNKKLNVAKQIKAKREQEKQPKVQAGEAMDSSEEFQEER